ncbi:MAG: uracil-DNA glycosylase [Acidobacteria bacterium]|nr:uracil-DNA glycosylase [Acidobacteriota bacterium]MBI3655832.1 uracil-DNA glycosylase [Acidobacteriota bacterium]
MAHRKSSLALSEAIGALQQEITDCQLCPRLVRWRERVAREKVRRFQEEEYWGRPVPSFGDPSAELLIVGLAPAAHGGNRTGRVFTGDRSGEWLFRALYQAGFANQPTSIHRNDGLTLSRCYITAAIHCAPPANKPLPIEIKRCRPYLLRELALLQKVSVIVALGRVAFDVTLAACVKSGRVPSGGRRRFSHGAEYRLNEDLMLLASFHPSQQNTFTGKLTPAMFQRIFDRARQLVETGKNPSRRKVVSKIDGLA